MLLRTWVPVALAVSLFVGICTSTAQADLTPVQSRVRFSYESIDMPAPDKGMGLVGFHYLVDVHENFHVGLGGYGAITGDRGGFLTGGVTGGLQKKLTGRLWLDAGMFIGSGGGGSAPQGDGLMLRPYAGLSYDLPAARFGLGFSRVDFPKTDISSNQLLVSVEFPFSYYLSNGQNGAVATALGSLEANISPPPGFVRQELLLILRNYSPTGSVHNTLNSPSNDRFGVVGVEFRHFIKPETFILVEALGAFAGDADGFAEILFGGGYRLSLTTDERLRLNLNLAVGAGGGGKVDVGGGGLVQIGTGLEYRFTPSVFAALNAGYIDSFNGSFKATVLGGAFGLSVDNLSSGFGSTPRQADDELLWNQWRIRASHLTYPTPDRKSIIADSNPLHLLGAKIDHTLTDRYYLTGQAASAYSGDAGGYAIGLIGIGMQTVQLKGSGFRLFGEVLAGAAGGGGIDVGDGALWQPMAGIDYAFNDAFSLQAMAGLIQAINGELDSAVYDISLSWRFASLGRAIH